MYTDNVYHVNLTHSSSLRNSYCNKRGKYILLTNLLPASFAKDYLFTCTIPYLPFTLHWNQASAPKLLMKTFLQTSSNNLTSKFHSLLSIFIQEHLTLFIGGLLLLEILFLPLVSMPPLSNMSPTPLIALSLSFHTLPSFSSHSHLIASPYIWIKKRSTENTSCSFFQHFITNIPCLTFSYYRWIILIFHPTSITHFYSDLPKDLTAAITPSFLYHKILPHYWIIQLTFRYLIFMI